jgi:nucleoside-diphosphate-sugar epimerase
VAEVSRVTRVLVTGASGCVGRNILPVLVERGWDVQAVSSRPQASGGDVCWHQADLLDPEQTRGVVRRASATHLLHLAWHLPPSRWAAAEESYQWVQASVELMRAFEAAGGQRIVGAGSCLEYDWSYGVCAEGRTPCVPHTGYGVCKNAAQQLLSSFTRDRALTSAWGRIFSLYGPYEHPDRLVPAVIRALIAGEPARCSHGRQIRDYLYAGDVAEAFVTLLESDLAGPLNIASGDPVRLSEIVTRVGMLMNRPELIQLGAIPAASTDLPVVVSDVTRLREQLRWRPRFSLDAGLEATIDWWRSQATSTVLTGAVR